MKATKYLGLILVILLVVATVAACGDSTPETTVAPSTTAAPPSTTAPAQVTTTAPAAVTTTAPAETTEVFKLKFSEGNPEKSAVGQVHQRWADMIEEKSNGRIDMEMYFSGALASQAERLRSTQTGIADISYYSIGTDRTLMPLSLVTALPFIGMPADMAKTTEIWWKLYDEFPEIQKEWESIQLLNGASMAPTQLHLTNKDARTPADLKGVKLISKGEQPLAMIEMGATPIDLQIGDWYTSLERGLADGLINHFPVCYVFKVLELVKHHTIFGDEGATMDMALFIMNKDSWNRLPADLQQVLLDAGKWQDAEIISTDIKEIQTAVDAAKAANHTFTELNEQELEVWRQAAKPAHDKWIAEFEAKGLPAQKVYDRCLALIEEYK